MAESDRPSLAGQTAVVTGSSSGIGRAIAIELAAAGVAVIVHARVNSAGAEETARAIGAAGGQARVELCDLADSKTHESLVERAWSWRGSVEIWVNNAGADILTGRLASGSFAEKLQALLDVDVAATIGLSRAIGRRMEARGQGAIVNIGWDRTALGLAGDSGELFAASKGAVEAFTRSLAHSLAPAVRVNCVAPGWIKTKWGDGASDEWQQRVRRESLLARWGQPEEIAAVVRFLVSPAASFVNAQTICVNGGYRT